MLISEIVKNMSTVLPDVHVLVITNYCLSLNLQNLDTSVKSSVFNMGQALTSHRLSLSGKSNIFRLPFHGNDIVPSYHLFKTIKDNMKKALAMALNTSEVGSIKFPFQQVILHAILIFPRLFRFLNSSVLVWP